MRINPKVISQPYLCEERIAFFSRAGKNYYLTIASWVKWFEIMRCTWSWEDESLSSWRTKRNSKCGERGEGGGCRYVIEEMKEVKRWRLIAHKYVECFTFCIKCWFIVTRYLKFQLKNNMCKISIIVFSSEIRH